jgi:hypothetical protein
MNNNEALEQAIGLTDEILVLLEEQDFSRIDALEAQRQSCIDQAFSQPIEQIDRIKSMHLLNLNQAVVEKLLVLKLSIRQKQQVASNASKATRAYQNHQR